MNDDGPRTRELSICSEKTLDNLETLTTPLTSPTHSEKGQRMRRSHFDGKRPGRIPPPHHGRASPLSQDEEEAPTNTPGRVHWQSENTAVPRSSDPQTSQFSMDYHGGEPPKKRADDMTKVNTGSDYSPIRKLKRKEEEPPKVERELSDAYIDSISRTPRYEYGRHNTYDDMLASMDPHDPYSNPYQPSGKSPREKSKITKLSKKLRGDKSLTKTDTQEQGTDIQMDKVKRKSKRKKRKGDDSLASTGTYSVDSQVNEAYTGTPSQARGRTVEPDKASVKSNGTFTLEKDKLGKPAVPQHHMKSPRVNVSMKCEYDKNQERNKDDVVKFVKEQKIVQLECNSYVADSKSPDGNCCCGRDRLWHEFKHLSVPDMSSVHKNKHIWHTQTHTEPFPTKAYGEIQFQGFGQETNSSPYIRLSPATDLEDVFDLLTKHWRLPLPKLLISVTGGAQRFNLSPRLKAVFKRGLINAATSTGAWIITGGTATGVMQFVGEAVRDHLIALGSNDNSVVALGIPTWGCVANREALEDDDVDGLFPAQYSLDEVSEVKGKDVPLDHNHTHFILVDDGTEGKFGGEITFRSTLERHVSEKVDTGLSITQSVDVPVVMLVVEGGVNTMKTVFQATQQNIPVLVLNGSGRVADFIAIGYQLSRNIKNDDKSVFRADFDEEMKAVAREKFAWKANDNVEKKIAECLKQLKDTLDSRHLVSVFNLSEADTNDIDRAILYALLKANKTNAQVQLALALAWNRCDIGRHEIFTQENRQYWKNIPLYDTMVTALVLDRVDFVQLFCENGVSLQKFTSIETLWNLYANVLDQNSPISHLVTNQLLYVDQSWASYLLCRNDDNLAHDPDLLLSVGKLLVHLLGDENMNIYNDPKFIVKDHPNLEWKPGNHNTDKHLSTHKSADSGHKFYKKKHRKYDFNNIAERELFIWAILNNRRELAHMFWRAGQDQLGAALLGCAILKALAKIADVDEELELSQDLMDHANLYEDMAVGVLAECYKKNKEFAHQLLVRQLPTYGRTTLFSLADTFTMMRFMGATCCQTKLNLIWRGRMALYTQSWKILLSLILPIFIPTIKFITEKKNNPEFDALEEAEEECSEANKDEGKILSSKVMPTTGEVEDEVFTRSKSRRVRTKARKLFRVHMFSNDKTSSIGIFSAIYYFYTAPVTVFMTNTISYLVFLGIFTFFLLTDLYPHTVSQMEYITWGWTITMFIEEFRQIVSTDRRSVWYKIRNWFDSLWNRFDLAMYMIFMLSVILRFVMEGEDFVYARVLYSITLAMYYMRFMQTFFVEKNMGPKVIMIKNMLMDLMFFVGIFIVFMLSFGVMYQANLFPNSPANWQLLKSVLYIPYWQMYGELFLEDMEGDSPDGCTKNESLWRPAGGSDRCPEKNGLVPLLAAAYLILTNILLVNLLIAMFSNTFQNVQDRSEEVWRYFRYGLVYEFYDRPVFCPPLIILSHIYRGVIWVYRKKCIKTKYVNEFRLKLDDHDSNKLTVFERAASENYLNISQKAQKEELGNKVADTANRIDQVIEELENIKESVRFTKDNKDELGRTALMEGPDLADSVTPLSARKQSNLTMTVQLLQEHLSELSDQVSKNTMQTSQMLQMMQATLTQQRQLQQRPSHLDITDVSQYDPETTEL